MPGKLQVVVGGQYGSEAKGAVAAELARGENDLLAVRVAGPNAGHTVIGHDGREWKLQSIPVAAVTNKHAVLGIAAGSEIELALLYGEIAALDEAGYDVKRRLYVDGSATLIEERHRDLEAGVRKWSAWEHQSLKDRIGSTGKGVGAARADRAMRNAELYGGNSDIANLVWGTLNTGGSVLVEGTQGYGLGQHAGHYPHCTSSDCRAVDFLSMAGISPWIASTLEIWVVLRTFPIRVAGNSGPLQSEISWDDLGVEPEHTTVTKKVRRVGEWDNELATEALRMNGAPNTNVKVALTFLDYLVPELAGVSGEEVLGNKKAREYVEDFEDRLHNEISMVGTGPSSYTRWER